MGNEKNPVLSAILAFMGLAILVLGGLAILKFRQPPAETATLPTAWEPYEARDRSFRCQLPAGWPRKDGGNRQSQSSWVICEKAGLRLAVETDFTQSLVGDLGRPMRVQPIETIHRNGRAAAQQKFRDYTEAEAKQREGGSGAALVSEFQAKQGLLPAIPIRGYRISIAGTDRAIFALAYCRERDFQALAPSLQQFLSGIVQRGG